MGTNPDKSEIGPHNLVGPTYEHICEEVRLMLEERKKKREEVDLKAVLPSSQEDQRGTITVINETNFGCTFDTASTSKVIIVVSASPTLDDVTQLIVDNNVDLVQHIAGRFLETSLKQPIVSR